MPDVSGSGTVIEGDVIVQGGDFVAGDKHVHIVEDPAAQRERRGQLILLEKVQAFWIEGVLHNSLHALGALSVQSVARPDLVAQPWQGVVDASAGAAGPVAIASLPACFDDCQGALLITGEPGSGKTTALLGLAQAFIERARNDSKQPVPVVFNLSTWGQNQRLEDWLVEELNTKYQIPREAARRWLLADALLLMLDGLDEVAETRRTDCVSEINRFRGEHGLVSLVVCTRLEEYLRTEEKLNLGAAALLQPLQPDQIEQAVAAQGAALAGLQDLLAGDPALRELVQSPLMLGIVAQVFASGGGKALPGAEQPVDALLEAYLQAAFNRRGGQLLPQAPAIRERLRYLAQKMLETNQSIFLIEDLQPGWLKPAMRLPYALLTRLVYGLLVGLLYLLLQISVFFNEAPIWNEVTPLVIIPCIFGGLAAGALFHRLMRQPPRVRKPRPTETVAPPWRRRASNLVSRYLHPVFNPQSLLFGLVCMLVLMFINAVVVKIALPRPADTFILYTVVPVLVLTTYSMVYGFAFPVVNEPALAEIDPVEAVLWSWRRARQSALAGLVVALVISVLFVLLANLVIQLAQLAPSTSLLAILIASVLLTLIIGLPLLGIPLAAIFGVLGGLRGRGVERGAQPNQGINQSLRSALRSLQISGLVGGVIVLGQRLLIAAALLLFAGTDPFAHPWTYPVSFLAFGLFLGGIAGLRYGGGSVIQHYILRWLLAREGSLPWKLVDLLEQAVSLALLRRAGSGYLFPHRLILEYIARQPASPQAKPTE